MIIHLFTSIPEVGYNNSNKRIKIYDIEIKEHYLPILYF